MLLLHIFIIFTYFYIGYFQITFIFEKKYFEKSRSYYPKVKI